MTSGRILVTGSAGFLGSEIITQSRLRGEPVVATDRVGSANVSGVLFTSADILDPDSLPRAFEGVDCVCHAAGLAHIFGKSSTLSALFRAVNVTGTQNVARAAIEAGVRNVVFASSVSVYGGEACYKDEESICQPEGPYAKSKFDAERCLVELCRNEGVNLTILRLATLYGEGDPGNVARLIDAIHRRRFVWVGKGDNLKSLLHREDAAKACILAMEKPATGVHIYNVSAPPVRMRDVVKEIAFATGKAIPAWHIPASAASVPAKILKMLSFNHGSLCKVHGTLQKWLADDYYNAEKFCDTFHYQAEVSLEEGIRREVKWYETKHRK